MKPFTTQDTEQHGAIADARSLYLDSYPQDLVSAPLWWHKRGLQKTASGYGAKIESQYKISFNGKLYRIYHTCYGNSSSAWFKVKGQTIYVN